MKSTTFDVLVPRMWGWCPVNRESFDTEQQARDWLSQFGPLDGRVVPRVPYPQFCWEPEKCAGKSYCPQQRSCAE